MFQHKSFNIISFITAVMEKSYGEIEKRNSQGKIDDSSKKNNVVVGHPLPKDEIISDTFKRTVNTHDVRGKIMWKKTISHILFS